MQLLNMEPVEGEGKQHLNFAAPSRGLIGFRSQVCQCMQNPHWFIICSLKS
jgi:predicted membrane GTPase involved in stress response